jgi:site-specific DNA-methyltransferase (adenine-specific)
VIPAFVVGGARVFAGDCREALKHLPDSSVDSVVTDPPYELGFMGKSWDSSGIAYDPAVWGECLRVLKPGGHILAFGGSRTWHRLAVAVEDAGFELRDSIAWIYGSGFPKSLDVSKAIDKKAGEQRERVPYVGGIASGQNNYGGGGSVHVGTKNGENPITSEAKAWEGWGTALKPAFEPVVVGRKPFGKGVTVAENVLAWGVGGLNIDGSRIGTTVETWPSSRNYSSAEMSRPGSTNASDAETQKTGPAPAGRWPANVIFDEVTAGLLDEQSGVLKSGAHNGRSVYSRESTETPSSFVQGMAGKMRNRTSPANEGGASRFFYVAKASKRDRNEGLEVLALRQATGGGGGIGDYLEDVNSASGKYGSEKAPAKNFHPTVKPTALMRYLIKLVTPPGGTVLDPFTGSGSTGKAALLDGFKFVGIELTEEYLPIIEGRLKWANEKVDEDDTLF